MKYILVVPLFLISIICSSQTVLTVTGQTLTNSYTVAHSVSTTFTFTNNSLTSSNTSGYQLNAGDEVPNATNSNLNGAVITGNKFIWNVSPRSGGTHGIFVGYQINNSIKYNYCSPTSYYGVVLKSGNSGSAMTDVSGVVAYNIFKDFGIGVLVKGFSGAKIYNNTFYNSVASPESSAIVFIQENDGSGGGNAPSIGTKIRNNIFYQNTYLPMIQVREASCTNGLESDYNIFYCAAGSPWFVIGSSTYTFSQWQALGYDIHSVVINPNFINTTDLLPSARLDYGSDLGSAYQTGLATNAVWNVGTASLTSNQNGVWQVGARIYGGNISGLDYVGASIENASPSVLGITYSSTLANIVPSASSFSVNVNSLTRSVNSVAVSGTKVMLTLASPVINGDIVTVAYTKPATNPIQTAAGAQAATMTAQTVTNNVAAVVLPQYVSSVIQNASPGILEMTYNLNLSNIIPAASSFSVMVNSVARSVNTVSISGTKVLLTLASPVVNGNVVTVAYTKPAVSALQTASGGQAATIGAQTVTNNVNAVVIPVYISSVVQNVTPTSLEMTYSSSLANIVPPTSSFYVTVNSVLRTVNNVTISGTKVLLTLASPVFLGDVVTVAYTKPATNPIQTTSGGVASSISAQSVTNTVTKNETPITVKMTIYPNPVRNIINIQLVYSGSVSGSNSIYSAGKVRIFDRYGKLFIDKFLDPGITSIRFPVNLKSGIYTLILLSPSNVEMASQIIIVN
jgi:uncharacterized repeat protein (TIGR02059 family)